MTSPAGYNEIPTNSSWTLEHGDVAVDLGKSISESVSSFQGERGHGLRMTVTHSYHLAFQICLVRLWAELRNFYLILVMEGSIPLYYETDEVSSTHMWGTRTLEYDSLPGNDSSPRVCSTPVEVVEGAGCNDRVRRVSTGGYL